MTAFERVGVRPVEAGDGTTSRLATFEWSVKDAVYDFVINSVTFRSTTKDPKSNFEGSRQARLQSLGFTTTHIFFMRSNISARARASTFTRAKRWARSRRDSLSNISDTRTVQVIYKAGASHRFVGCLGREQYPSGTVFLRLTFHASCIQRPRQTSV